MNKNWGGFHTVFRSHMHMGGPQLFDSEPLPCSLTWECTRVVTYLRNVFYPSDGFVDPTLYMSNLHISGDMAFFFLSQMICMLTTLMMTMIMIYYVLFSILIKETLSKFRRLSPDSALQVLYFCQYSSQREIFCLCDMSWRFTKRPLSNTTASQNLAKTHNSI